THCYFKTSSKVAIDQKGQLALLLLHLHMHGELLEMKIFGGEIFEKFSGTEMGSLFEICSRAGRVLVHTPMGYPPKPPRARLHGGRRTTCRWSWRSRRHRAGAGLPDADALIAWASGPA